MLICKYLRGLSGVFLHHILDKFGALGQADAEVAAEQEAEIRVGLGHGSQVEHALPADPRHPVTV